MNIFKKMADNMTPKQKAKNDEFKALVSGGMDKNLALSYIQGGERKNRIQTAINIKTQIDTILKNSKITLNIWVGGQHVRIYLNDESSPNSFISIAGNPEIKINTDTVDARHTDIIKQINIKSSAEN